MKDTSIDLLIVGGGGREHALAWKLKQSSRAGKIYVAPGNGGTSNFAENVDISATDIERLLAFAKEKNVGLTIVGPENSLETGVVDAFKAARLKIFGPTKAAARIESSKAFAKQLMRTAGIPTAQFKTFTDEDSAKAYVHERGAPIVIKDDGLVRGKGVHICRTIEEAGSALDEIFSGGVRRVVIEDFLEGPEVSIHAICAGTDLVLFPASQDHKRIGEGDTGNMTGGIGAIFPLSFVTLGLMTEIEERVVRPVLETLAKNGTPFSGLLYPGLILTKTGPKVLEFNSRFGDPECELYMRLLKNDLLPMLEASAHGDLNGASLEWEIAGCVNLVLCSGGYPDEYKKGLPISGVEEAEKVEGVVIFHAGTVKQGGSLLTDGGRVLGVSAVGGDLNEALERAYRAADLIHFEGKYVRRDIGAKVLSAGV